MKPHQPSTLTRRLSAAAPVVCRVLRNLPALGVIAVSIASSIVLTISGCASSSGIAPVAQAIAPAKLGLDGGATVATVEADWWRAFGDANLSGLVERSLADQPSLKLAQARLARAEAAVSGSRASDGPQLNGAVDATRQRFSGNSIYPPPLGGSTRTIGTVQLNGAWELDFFGRNRAALEAAIGAQRAAGADLQAARNLLAINVARGYVQLGRLLAQRDVALRALAQRDQTLALIRQRVQGGLDTAVEQRQGESALPETRQQIEQLDEQVMLTRHALAALTVQPPEALANLTAPLRTVQLLALPDSVPADLLGRRADIAAARARIEAARSDVQSAKAQFYPNINLTAFVGLSSIGLDRLVQSGSEQYGAGPALRLPIFDSGRLRANLRGKTADLDAAVESYNNAVVDAVHDAADQIGSLRSIDRQRTEQALAERAAESAFDLATQRYRAGLGGYLTVLNAETVVLAQRRLGADLRARALDTQIALIRALGGGYVDPAAAATAATAHPTDTAPPARIPASGVTPS
jgi:NodT family efflux transporter outer membrane factor (OMF) lipoprotein